MLLDSKIFDASQDAFFVVEGETVTWVNGGAARMLGVSASAIVGAPLAKLLASGERERLRLFATQRQEGWDIPATCRVRFVRLSDRHEVTTDLRVGQVAAPGRPTLILTARDVSDVTRAEQLMGQLAQLSGSGAAALDADALLDASEPLFVALGWRVAFTEITEGGSITRRMLAAPPGDPVGDYGRSIIGVEMSLDETPVLAEVVRTGDPIFLDNLPTLGEGPERRATNLGASMARARLIRSAWCPVVTKGRFTHLLAVTGKELTAHDFVAVQLFAAQLGAANCVAQLRAEAVHRERLAAVGEMAAVLAHEVRNPLAVMFNALSELRRPASAPVTGPALLAIIQEEAERLKRLVSDLLDFSRPAAPQMQAVDVVAVMRDAIAAAGQDPTCPGARAVALEVPSNLPRVRTDPHLLWRVLVNLLLNAHQWVSPAGKVTLSAVASGEKELRLQVRNDGTSIASSHADRIFEPFFTTKATGTGLGLAVVRRLVDDLEGRIELDRSETGTAFSLWLPVVRAS